MKLKDWEATIQQIVSAASHAPKEFGKDRILTAWRAKLEKEPASLLPFQIDKIVREVRTRLTRLTSVS